MPRKGAADSSLSTVRSSCKAVFKIALRKKSHLQLRTEMGSSWQLVGLIEMSDAAYMFPGCDCRSHQYRYEYWLPKDAVLHFASCMRRCPYCGKCHSNASRLCKHLRTQKDQNWNLTAKNEHAGAAGVEYNFLYLLVGVDGLLIGCKGSCLHAKGIGQ